MVRKRLEAARNLVYEIRTKIQKVKDGPVSWQFIEDNNIDVSPLPGFDRTTRGQPERFLSDADANRYALRIWREAIFEMAGFGPEGTWVDASSFCWAPHDPRGKIARQVRIEIDTRSSPAEDQYNPQPYWMSRLPIYQGWSDYSGGAWAIAPLLRELNTSYETRLEHVLGPPAAGIARVEAIVQDIQGALDQLQVYDERDHRAGVLVQGPHWALKEIRLNGLSLFGDGWWEENNSTAPPVVILDGFMTLAEAERIESLPWVRQVTGNICEVPRTVRGRVYHNFTQAVVHPEGWYALENSSTSLETLPDLATVYVLEQSPYISIAEAFGKEIIYWDVYDYLQIQINRYLNAHQLQPGQVQFGNRKSYIANRLQLPQMFGPLNTHDPRGNIPAVVQSGIDSDTSPAWPKFIAMYIDMVDTLDVNEQEAWQWVSNGDELVEAWGSAVAMRARASSQQLSSALGYLIQGLNPSTVKAWLLVGIWSSEAMLQLIQAGIMPKDLENLEWPEDDVPVGPFQMGHLDDDSPWSLNYDGPTPAFAFSIRDLSLNALQQVIAIQEAKKP